MSLDLQEKLVPRKELEEVPRGQMEDSMQEEATRGLSEEKQAKCSYYSSHRRTSEGSEWMSRYIAGRSELHAQSFQDEQSSSDHVHEAE